LAIQKIKAYKKLISLKNMRKALTIILLLVFVTVLKVLEFGPTIISLSKVIQDTTATRDSQAMKINPACEDNKADKKPECWEYITIKTLRQKGVGAAFDEVKKLSETNKNFSRNCHALAHLIGKESFDLFENKKDFKMSQNANYCGFGFYHGFVEEMIVKTSDPKQAEAFCDYIDKQLDNEAVTGLYCYHGIGHGLATVHEKDENKDIKELILPALKICSKIANTKRQESTCASGVFNTLALYHLNNEYDIGLDEKDPLSLCYGFEERYREGCFSNMNTILAELSGRDVRLASERFINHIKEDKLAITAMQAVLFLTAIDNINQNEKAINICRSLAPRLRLPCIPATVHGLIEFGDPGREHVAALNFCETKILTADERRECLKEATFYFYTIYEKRMADNLCQGIKNRPAEVKCKN
jgi:hypothetical protein